MPGSGSQTGSPNEPNGKGSFYIRPSVIDKLDALGVARGTPNRSETLAYLLDYHDIMESERQVRKLLAKANGNRA